MADRIIKGDSGNDVVIQNNAGSRKIEVTNSGDVEVTGDIKTTTVKATNIKANDGTAGLVVADSTGEVTSSGGLKATNIKTTNLKANDGTASLSIADSTGQVTSSAKIDLNGNELILDADADSSITADSDDQIDFRAGGQDSVKIGNEHLTINDGNLIIGTAGHGVDFSVNTHASGMTSELLDSYEEGTWTGTVTASTTAPNSPATATGYYTKIGRLVTIRFLENSVNMTGSSGAMIITGIPFNNGSHTDNVALGSCVFFRTIIPTNTNNISSVINAGGDHVYFQASIDDDAYQSITDNSTTNTRVWFTITYEVS